MPDLRYLDDKEKFMGYSFDVLKNHFSNRNEFNQYFDSIENDFKKNKFLQIASFYKFLVIDGMFYSGDEVIEYLDTTYKYVAIFSFIDAIYDRDDYKDFYAWLKMNSSEVFPIIDDSKLDALYITWGTS